MLDPTLAPPEGAFIDFTIDDLTIPGFQSAYKFWLAEKEANDMPSVSALDPTNLPRQLLPSISLIGVEYSPLSFKIRLMGNEIVEKTGVNFTGKNLSDIPDTEKLVTRFTWVSKTGKPYATHTKAAWSTKTFRDFDFLILPFSHDGYVTKLMAIMNVRDPA